MNLTLNRKYLLATCTIGELLIDGLFYCYTLEPFYRGECTTGDSCALKVEDKTAIPCGTYPVVMAFSPKHNMNVPHIQNVPCFQEIEMHVGNTAADTDGCVLLGELQDIPNQQILQSRSIVEKFYALDFSDVTITIAMEADA